MNEQLEKLANQAEEEAKIMQFKTSKQIDDFLKSVENDDNIDD